MPRQKKAVAEKRHLIRLELTQAERALLRAEAGRHDLPMSQYVRLLVLAQLKKSAG
jgi:hypothetical protein